MKQRKTVLCRMFLSEQVFVIFNFRQPFKVIKPPLVETKNVQNAWDVHKTMLRFWPSSTGVNIVNISSGGLGQKQDKETTSSKERRHHQNLDREWNFSLALKSDLSKVLFRVKRMKKETVDQKQHFSIVFWNMISFDKTWEDSWWFLGTSVLDRKRRWGDGAKANEKKGRVSDIEPHKRRRSVEKMGL